MKSSRLKKNKLTQKNFHSIDLAESIEDMVLLIQAGASIAQAFSFLANKESPLKEEFLELYQNCQLGMNGIQSWRLFANKYPDKLIARSYYHLEWTESFGGNLTLPLQSIATQLRLLNCIMPRKKFLAQPIEEKSNPEPVENTIQPQVEKISHQHLDLLTDNLKKNEAWIFFKKTLQSGFNALLTIPADAPSGNLLNELKDFCDIVNIESEGVMPFLLQATSGKKKATLGIVHSHDSLTACFNRLQILSLNEFKNNLFDLDARLFSYVSNLISLKSLPNKGLCISQISELFYIQKEINTHKIYQLKESGRDLQGNIQGAVIATGLIPTYFDHLI